METTIMKISILTLLCTIALSFNSFGKTAQFRVHNFTYQMITDVQYWIGSQNESLGSTITFRSRGSLEYSMYMDIPVKYSKKKNTILIKAYLIGGGFVKRSFFISKEDEKPNLKLYNLSVPVDTDNYEEIVKSFTKLKLDDGYESTSIDVAKDALIGSLIVYDKNNNKLTQTDPKVLGTRVDRIPLPSLTQVINGTFSERSAAEIAVNIGVVGGSGAFSTGDVAEFSWKVKNVGKYTWSTSDGESVEQKLLDLPKATKDYLIHLWQTNKDIKLKFVNQVFAIGSLEIKTKKSRKIGTEIELNAGNYVTSKGNYMFIDDLSRETELNNIVTETKELDYTGFLEFLYKHEQAKKNAQAKMSNDQEVRDYYQFLRELYPNKVAEVNSVSLMKKVILELENDEEFQLSLVQQSISGSVEE